MPVFELKAKTREGRALTTTVVAQNREVAVRRTRARGVYVVEVRRLRPRGRGASGWVAGVLRPVSPAAKAVFLRQLHELLTAGIGLAETFDQLRFRVTDARLRRLCDEARAEAIAGKSLSEILAARPGVIEPWIAAAIGAAERAGAVDKVLPSLEQDIRNDERERRRATFPAIYTKAIAVFAVMAATIPVAITHGLVGWITNTLVNGVPLLALAWAALMGVRIVAALPRVRALLDRVLMHVPVIGRGRRTVYALRFLRAYTALVHAGTSPQEAFEAASSAAGPAWLEMRGEYAADHLRRGGDLATALRMLGALDTETRGLIETADDTGELDSVLADCVRMLEERADRESIRRTVWVWALLLLLSAILVIAGVVMGMVGYYNKLMEWADSLTEDL